MKSLRLTGIIAITLFAVAMPVSLAAQAEAKEHHTHQYHHYQVVDMGTFGGPQSFLNQDWPPRAGILNNRGSLTGAAETITVDPYCVWSKDCYASHAFRWRNGGKTDLGVLSGGIGSQVNWISANGLVAGISDNGQPDPLSGGALPQIHGVLWQRGGMTDLGTLPEGGYESWPYRVNNRGEVAGQAFNTIPDPDALFGYGYQSRAFYWKDGVMKDLGTLGTGTDALGSLINERGQVVGWSYTNSIPSPICPAFGFALTTSTFSWDKKNGMRDIGGLGGTCTLAFDLNNPGQIVGTGSRADDQFYHPFVWDPETGISELPTYARLYGAAWAISDGGEAVGSGDSPGGNGALDAMLWRKIGGKWRNTDLGSLNGCSTAQSVNASVQVVGQDACAGLAGLAFLSEDGGPMVDLNTLIPPNSGIQLFEGQQINDRGEIAAEGQVTSGDYHAVLLIPCDENHQGLEGCDYSMVDAAAVTRGQSPQAALTLHGAMRSGTIIRCRVCSDPTTRISFISTRGS